MPNAIGDRPVGGRKPDFAISTGDAADARPSGEPAPALNFLTGKPATTNTVAGAYEGVRDKSQAPGKLWAGGGAHLELAMNQQGMNIPEKTGQRQDRSGEFRLKHPFAARTETARPACPALRAISGSNVSCWGLLFTLGAAIYGSGAVVVIGPLSNRGGSE